MIIKVPRFKLAAYLCCKFVQDQAYGPKSAMVYATLPASMVLMQRLSAIHSKNPGKGTEKNDSVICMINNDAELPLNYFS